MSFFGFINVYSLRVNLSVALVAMIDTEYVRQLEAHTPLPFFDNTTYGPNDTVTAAMVADNGEPQCETESSAVNLTVATNNVTAGGHKVMVD